jgi:hypothetical protein
VRLFAEIEHRPVPDFVLADGQLRHPVAIPRPAALRRLSTKLHVDAFVERDLAADVFLTACDEVGSVGHPIIIGRAPVS